MKEIKNNSEIYSNNNRLVSVVILNYNQKKYLKNCINSVSDQNYSKISIIIIDNGSTDGSAEFIKMSHPHIKLEENKSNAGYSAACNQILKTHKEKYILFLNADVFLGKNFIEEMVKTIEEDKKAGICHGKLYRMSSDNGKVFDSAGVVLCKNRRNIDRGFNCADTGQYNSREYVFGSSGAALFCRREMLEDIKINNEYFDEDFFAYREEADLAWRAQLAGWRCVYAPTAVAYHYRTYAPDRRKKMPKKLKELQYRNRYLMIIKNELLLTLILHLPYILFFEICSFLYVLFCEPFLIKTWPEIIKLAPKMLKKRQQIMKKRRVSAKYILSIIK